MIRAQYFACAVDILVTISDISQILHAPQTFFAFFAFLGSNGFQTMYTI